MMDSWNILGHIVTSARCMASCGAFMTNEIVLEGIGLPGRLPEMSSVGPSGNASGMPCFRHAFRHSFRHDFRRTFRMPAGLEHNFKVIEKQAKPNIFHSRQ